MWLIAPLGERRTAHTNQHRTFVAMVGEQIDVPKMPRYVNFVTQQVRAANKLMVSILDKSVSRIMLGLLIEMKARSVRGKTGNKMTVQQICSVTHKRLHNNLVAVI